MKIPEVVQIWNLYGNGEKLSGVNTKLKLPVIKQITEKLSYAGMLGEWDVAVVGSIENLDLEIEFGSIDLKNYGLACRDDTMLVARAATQCRDTETGKVSPVQIKVTALGSTNELDPGEIENGKKMNAKIKKSLTKYKIEIFDKNDSTNNCVLFEIDKPLGIYTVMGKDMMADIRDLV